MFQVQMSRHVACCYLPDLQTQQYSSRQTPNVYIGGGTLPTSRTQQCSSRQTDENAGVDLDFSQLGFRGVAKKAPTYIYRQFNVTRKRGQNIPVPGAARLPDEGLESASQRLRRPAHPCSVECIHTGGSSSLDFEVRMLVNMCTGPKKKKKKGVSRTTPKTRVPGFLIWSSSCCAANVFFSLFFLCVSSSTPVAHGMGEITLSGSAGEHAQHLFRCTCAPVRRKTARCAV